VYFFTNNRKWLKHACAMKFEKKHMVGIKNYWLENRSIK